MYAICSAGRRDREKHNEPFGGSILPVGIRDPRMPKMGVATMGMQLSDSPQLQSRVSGVFPEETIRRRYNHKRRNVPMLLEASPEVFLFLLSFLS
jgi:hypothetical protein